MINNSMHLDDFISEYVGAVYADGNEKLVEDWQTLPTEAYAEQLAQYVFSGSNNNNNKINWTINEDEIIISQTLLG